MSRLEVFSVRIGIIILHLSLLLVVAFAYNGVDISDYLCYFTGHSVVPDFVLLQCCLNNKKYHCRYMRYLVFNLLFISFIGGVDTFFGLFDALIMCYVYIITWTSSTLITIYLAINHFTKLNCNKNKDAREYLK